MKPPPQTQRRNPSRRAELISPEYRRSDKSPSADSSPLGRLLATFRDKAVRRLRSARKCRTEANLQLSTIAHDRHAPYRGRRTHPDLSEHPWARGQRRSAQEPWTCWKVSKGPHSEERTASKCSWIARRRNIRDRAIAHTDRPIEDQERLDQTATTDLLLLLVLVTDLIDHVGGVLECFVRSSSFSSAS